MTKCIRVDTNYEQEATRRRVSAASPQVKVTLKQNVGYQNDKAGMSAGKKAHMIVDNN